MAYKRLSRARGAATLLITTLMVVSITMIAIVAANYSMLQQKISTDSWRNDQAFEAAEAGLEFGINYLNQNASVIVGTPVSGYIQSYSSSSTHNVQQADGTTFTIQYTNPVAYNYNLITVRATGVSSDGAATKTVQQQVQYGTLLVNLPPSTVLTSGAVHIIGSSTIKNLTGNYNIESGGVTTISNSSETVLSTGVSSNAGYLGSDVLENNTALAAISPSDLFSTYFGVSEANAKSKANYVFENLSNYSSQLNGLSGVMIWIDQSTGLASLYAGTTVGTSLAPVLLVVNGDLYLAGDAIINGLVVLLGSASQITGTSQINGGLISTGGLSLSSSPEIMFNNAALQTVQNSNNTYYAKVSGTWIDF